MASSAGSAKSARSTKDKPAAKAAPAGKAAKPAKPAPALAAAKTVKAAAAPAGQQIDERIAELGGWRGETLARVRALIRDADPQVVEEWKWSVPVWSHDGILCTGETYKAAVKLTFLKGASIPDPSKLFNSSLDGNARRAIDLREGDAIDEKAFKALIRAAVEVNKG